MTTHTKWIIGIVIVVLAGGFFFLSNEDESFASGEPIKIGAVLSFSGPAANFGESAKQGIDLAVEEINKNGGMNGRLVEVIYQDDRTSAKDAVLSYRKLVDDDQVDAIIGSVWDFTTQPLLPLAEEDHITLIAPIDFRLKDTFELGENTFVPFPSFNKVVQHLKRYIDEQDVQKMGVVRFTSSFAQVIRNTLGDIMQERNNSTVIDEIYTTIGSNDFRTTVAKLQEKEVDFVFVDAIDSDILNFLQSARELGFKGVIASHTSALDLIDNPDVENALLEGLVILDWQIAPEKFKERFEEKYGFTPKHSADSSYNVLYILAEAVAHSNTRAEVRDYVEGNTFTTINGDFTFNKNHTIDSLPVNIEIVRDGKAEVLYSTN